MALENSRLKNARLEMTGGSDRRGAGGQRAPHLIAEEQA